MRKGMCRLILASVLALGFWPMVASAQETVSKEVVAAKSPNLFVLSESLDKLQQQAADAKASADNAWMLMSAALVLLMTGPGLALFYGGLVRKKNVLATMMQSFSLMAGVTTGFPFTYYLSRPEQRRRLFEAVSLAQDPHLVFASSSYREQERVKGRLVHVVERQGAPLLYIFETRPLD